MDFPQTTEKWIEIDLSCLAEIAGKFANISPPPLIALEM